jgi:hypothetical protein
MKASAEKQPEQFSPVKLTLIFETQEEVDLMLALCNFRPINKVLDPLYSEAFRVLEPYGDYEPAWNKMRASLTADLRSCLGI